MNNHFKYTTKVWLTGVIATPVLFCGLHISKTDPLINPETVFRLIGGGWVVGAVFSMPGLLLAYFLVRWIDAFEKSIRIKKVYIQACALLLTQGLFLLFDAKGKLGWRAFWIHGWDQLPFYYWCTLSFGVWFFKFTSKIEESIA